MSLIQDGKSLGFSKGLLARYTKQLAVLKKEAKESRGKGIVLDETEALVNKLISNAKKRTENSSSTKEKTKVLPVCKSKNDKVETKVYVSGFGYITKEEKVERREKFKKLVGGLAGKERARGNKYIIACNQQVSE